MGTNIKRRNKTIEQQSVYYECEDFRYFIIDQWIYGYNIYKYYMELSVTERYKFIHWLIIDTPHKDWKNIVLYLLNPQINRNNGNR